MCQNLNTHLGRVKVNYEVKKNAEGSDLGLV